MASAELRIINRRIKSVKSTKKITRAMELIASSRIVKAQQRLTSSNNYTNLLSQIVEELTGSGNMPSSPIVEGTKKITLVVITSDRGLAGAYNTNILKLAEIRRGADRRRRSGVLRCRGGRRAALRLGHPWIDGDLPRRSRSSDLCRSFDDGHQHRHHCQRFR